ncbi:hypothetical protein TB1_009362 [Malus domestica]
MAAYDYDDAGTYDETSATQRQPSSGAPPSSDLGYDPNFVPDSVKSFVVHLYRYTREKNVYEIHQMYETSFQTLSNHSPSLFWNFTGTKKPPRCGVETASYINLGVYW